MQVATFITLLTFTFSAGLHYTDGEEFTWPSFTVTLSGVTTPLSNTTSTPPFLLVNDVAPHSMSLTYNFPANSGWISQQITNFHSVRLDSGRSLQLGFNLAISTSSNSSTQLILSYRRTASDGSTSAIVKVLRFQCTLAYCSSNFAGTTATLSGVVFQQIGQSFFKRYMQASPSTWNADIISIGEWFVASGMLLPQDQLYDIRLGLQVWGSGSYSFSMNPVVPDYWDFYGNTSISVNSLKVIHEAVPWALSTLDYSNTTVPAGGAQSVALILYGFRFLTSSNASSLKVRRIVTQGCSHVVVGFYLGSWVTPINAFLLPISLASKAIFQVNFSFLEKDLSYPTQKAACVAMYLRNDFTTDFPNQTHQGEVRVCQWHNKLSSSPSLQNVYLDKMMYSLYGSTQAGIQETGSKQVFTFLAISNSTQVKNLDIFAFARFLVQFGYVNSSYLLASVSAGFYAYYGTATFQFQQVQFSTRIVDNYAQGMNVTLVAPLQCLYLQYSVETQECLPNKQLYLVILYLVSTPSVALLLRLTPVVVLFDELAYYSYHTAPYDRSFKALADFAWNITNSKWFPAALQFLFDAYQNYIVLPVNMADSRAVSLQSLTVKGEDIFFLNMTLDFWVWTVPLTCLSFSLLYLFRKLIKNNFIRLLLFPFSSISYLLINLIGDNLVFMAFRGFMQLRFTVLNMKSALLSTSNLVLSLLSLWVVTCLGISIPIFIHRWGRPYRFNELKSGYQSCVFYSGMQLMRIATGFLHASELPVALKLSCLTILHITDLGLTIKFRSLTTIRTFLIQLITQFVKIVLHGLLIFEVEYGDVQGSILNNAFNNATAGAVGALFCLLFLSLVVDIAVKLYNIIKQNCAKLNDSGTSVAARIARRKKIIPTKLHSNGTRKERASGCPKAKAAPADAALQENKAINITVKHQKLRMVREAVLHRLKMQGCER